MHARLLVFTTAISLLGGCGSVLGSLSAPHTKSSGSPRSMMIAGALMVVGGGALIAISEEPGHCAPDEQIVTAGRCQVGENLNDTTGLGVMSIGLGAILGVTGLVLEEQR